MLPKLKKIVAVPSSKMLSVLSYCSSAGGDETNGSSFFVSTGGSSIKSKSGAAKRLFR
jgi:hypothetical protein